MVAFELKINGVSYIQQWRRDTFNISKALQANGATMECDLNINNEEIAPPLEGQFIQFWRGDILEFAGRIATISQTQSGSGNRKLNYALSCVDQTIDLDAELLVGEYAAQRAGDMIRTIVGQVGRGFTSDNTVDGPMVAAVQVDLDYPSSAISRIAESIEHQWYVDVNRDLNFFYVLDKPAPVPLINLDIDTTTYFDAEIDRDWEQVKNVVYLAGGKARSSGAGGEPRQDTINAQGDGGTAFYPLNYEPWSVENTTVTVDGIPQEILLDTIDGQAGDGQGEAGQCYLCLDNWGVRFPDNHPPGNPLDPDNPADVDIGYAYAYEPVVRVEDPTSIMLMQERENHADAPSNGIHEFKFEIPDLRVETEDSIFDYGNLILARYSRPLVNVAFSSRVQGWQVGQFFRMLSVSSKRNIDEVLYVTNISQRVYVAHDARAEFEYDIQASSRPYPA